ncbi:primosomal protein [Prescottella agglutinans]|uniref:Primosomal protein n=1 Tax=Prescottella agglutinans TaxID=1644129 RepID=A0A3S3ALX3_9NOCA|nr:primosomal protein [Prescottella agglutinans]RVW11454.1 primosomal protein [Prescottella agglutinans]
MAGDIVPIELGLTRGDLVTLWAPRWREGDDEWEAFLGHEEDLYGFGSVAALAAFIRTDDDNDLVEHPAWPVVSKLAAPELEPEESHTFDLVGVPELAAGDPEALTLTELESTFDMVRNIGEVCDLEPVVKFFENHPETAYLRGGVEQFVGRDGEALWDRIGTAVAEDWDAVIDAIDSIVATPDVDADALSVAEAEILAAEENVVDADDDAEDAEDYEEFDAEDQDEEQEETFWTGVGIDPIKIITPVTTYYSLRCYLDEHAVFLGRGGRISVFGSERALARYLADNHDHDLARVSTYENVQNAAVDGSLHIEVTDENVYVLPGLADDLAEGPDAVDADQLELAVELFTDAADFARDDATDAALASSTPLGWYVSYILEPTPGRMTPNPPFQAEAETWRALEAEFEARLRPE